ncbi:MAG TPA: TetR/AcrR family transcriptional regulator [Acidimicrobiia bacterium]|nr:TetR/AcrR family transcriptional regulator [Acidimicrobiia bacterium]
MARTQEQQQASTRRIGAPDSKTRALLVDAAERLMLGKGYAAVSSRRVAGEAGLKPQLVHYYFRTMDDLFLAVLRRRAEESLERYARALASDRPLRALWEMSTDPRGAVFTMEFAALANHRKAIRAEIAAYAERVRQMQLDALARILDGAGIPEDDCPPVVVLQAMTGISQVIALEETLGITTGHEETRSFVERQIDQLEDSAAA